MISIREVAKLANVSPATVSRVINKTANVAKDKEERVLLAIQETGFKPNELARALFKQSLKIVGVIVPNIENPFFSEISKVIEEELYIKGYKMLLCSSNNNSKKEIENIEMLSQMKANSIIIITNNDDVGEVLEKTNMTTVALDRKLTSIKNSFSIESDNYEGGKIATKHLLDCGCKNIVCFKDDRNLSSSKKRFEGYEEICKKYSIEKNVINCKYRYDEGLKATERMLKKYKNIDGIVANNDIVAISIYKILTQYGYNVPKDIQLVGFDNIKFSKLFTPELTTIEQPIKDMGKLAVDIVTGQENNQNFQKENILKVRLIERQTTRRIDYI